MKTATKSRQLERITAHGRSLLAIFPNAKEQDPVKLCKRLRAMESRGQALALRLCNGPEFSSEDEADRIGDAIIAKVNALLGNVNEYQPKTGAPCVCSRGVQRDNCSRCEGTGQVVDFAAIRARKPLVPVFLNHDPRGYALKIGDNWMREHKAALHQDWGGYGILAPEIDEKE